MENLRLTKARSQNKREKKNCTGRPNHSASFQHAVDCPFCPYIPGTEPHPLQVYFPELHTRKHAPALFARSPSPTSTRRSLQCCWLLLRRCRCRCRCRCRVVFLRSYVPSSSCLPHSLLFCLHLNSRLRFRAMRSSCVFLPWECKNRWRSWISCGPSCVNALFLASCLFLAVAEDFFLELSPLS